MNISSIRNNWSLYASCLNTNNTTNSQTSFNQAELEELLSNEYGDTLELSGSTQNIANYPMYSSQGTKGPQGPPPIPGMKDFLDKVANGTATDDDLKNMQTILQKAQSNESETKTGLKKSGTDEIGSFLDKVASGTTTSDDLKNMQSFLQQVQQKFDIANGSSASQKEDELKTFMDKVANGTVTDADLKNMQTVLQQMQQSSDSSSTNHHHHHQSSGSDRTNPISTNLDATSSVTNADSSMKDFLDKVANGTVTDDDLKNIQNVLQQMQQKFWNGLGKNDDNEENSGLTVSGI